MSGANVSPIGRNKEEWFVPPTDYRKLNEPPVLDVSPYRAHASRRAFQRNGAIYLMARPPLLCQGCQGGEFHSDASRHFRFIVFSPTRLFCLPRSGGLKVRPLNDLIDFTPELRAAALR